MLPMVLPYRDFSRLLGVPVSPGARLVLVALGVHANGDRVAWPSRALLARELSWHENTVKKHMGVLRDGGWVHSVRTQSGWVHRLARCWDEVVS
jgi:hypothetical protein